MVSGGDEAGATPLWGPYLSERAWGTVREDYGPDGNAWGYFSTTMRGGGRSAGARTALAGLCDREQRLCLALGLWNGRDPILKERAFGLVNYEGNHGEDVKEYWWYPTRCLTTVRWVALPSAQVAFPYDDLVKVNLQRGGAEPEYGLLDTNAFGDGYWICEVAYAQVDLDDIVMRIAVTNASDAAAHLHVLPTLWFRNTWSWDLPAPAKPELRLDANRVIADHPTLGRYALAPADAPDGARTGVAVL